MIFSPATHGKILEEKISSLQNGEVLLAENTRYEDVENKKKANVMKNYPNTGLA